ncbi:hypothetical protein [Sorangium sp. So ce1389]|uniref:hypothetical protein n=1 Tax=Sorangium sp. So ce1389 TaxID=3133336 RepID=UPI003F63210F
MWRSVARLSIVTALSSVAAACDDGKGGGGAGQGGTGGDGAGGAGSVTSSSGSSGSGDGGSGGSGDGGSGDGGSSEGGSGSGEGGSGSGEGGSGSDGSGDGGSGGSTQACVPFSTTPCYTGRSGSEGIGQCVAGVATCAADGAGFGPCIGEVTPATEVCTTPADEDCDGVAAPPCAGGEHLWSRHFGLHPSSEAADIVMHPSGYTLIVGSMRRGVGPHWPWEPAVRTYDNDVLFAKLPSVYSSSERSWVNSFGGSGDERATGIALDAQGDALVVGIFDGLLELSGDAADLTSRGGTDIFVAKFDRNGPAVWATQLGGAGDDHVSAVASDADGSLVIAGHFEGTAQLGGEPLVSAGGADAFVAKLDGAGAPVWSRRLGGEGDQHATGVALGAAGDVFLAGRFEGEMELDGLPLVSAGGVDAFVAQLDAAGEPGWIQRFGGTGHDEASDVAVDDAQRVVVTGSFEGTADFGGGPLVSAGGADAFVAQLDAAGLPLYSFRLGGEGEQAGRSLSAGPSGTMALGGLFQGSITLGDQALTSSGVTDAFWAKLDGDGHPLLGGRVGDGGDQRHVQVASATSGVIGLAGAYQGEIALGSETLMSSEQTAYAAEILASGAFDYTWHFDARGEQHGRDVAVDPSGNVFLLGSFESRARVGDVPITKSTLSAYTLLVKLDPSGEPLWHKVTAEHGIYMSPNAIATDALGNVILAGTVPSSGWDEQMEVVKLDAAGALRWRRSYWHRYGVEGLDVVVDPAGDIVLLGRTAAAELNFGGGPFPIGGAQGSQRDFLLKLSGDAEVLWAKVVDDDHPSGHTRIGVDAAGNVAVTWITVNREPFWTETIMDLGDSDLVMRKLDPAGNELWRRSFGTGSEDNGYIGLDLAAVDGAGNLLVHTTLFGQFDFGGGLFSGYTGLVKFDPEGQFLWNISPSAEVVTTMTPVGHDGLLLAGRGPSTLRLIELDGAGTERWRKDLDDAATDLSRASINAVAWDGAGGVLLAGEFQRKIDFGGSALYRAGVNTMFAAKLAR